MKNLHFFLIAVVVLLFGRLSRAAENTEFKIIVNSGVNIKSISRVDLGRIFLKRKTTFPDGTKAKPVDQTKTSATRIAFSKKILKKTVATVFRYWQQQVFSGRDTPPPSVRSDKDVVNYVKKTPGAIGYVSKNADTTGVKVVTVTE